MNRLACVDVPALPLQILLRRHPGWRGQPAAFVADDRVQARVRFVNREARRRGVRRGMKQVAAVACCPDLRIGHLPPSEIGEEVGRLAERLHRWSPQVETARPEGCGGAYAFWLRASGLSTLFGSLSCWSVALREDLKQRGMLVSVTVGFTRFGAFAGARSIFGQQVFPDPASEKRSTAAAPLRRFELPEKVLAALEKLGIRTLQDLLRLSARGLGRRFGPEAAALYRLASGENDAVAFRAAPPETPFEQRVDFEPAERDRERLLRHGQELLGRLLDQLRERALALVELTYELHPESGGPLTGEVRPALPTTDVGRLLALLRLRLEADLRAAGGGPTNRFREPRPAGRFTVFILRARGGRQVTEPTDLFGGASPRDPKKASEALARIQAEFGEGELVRLEIREGHLPRSRYRCRPIQPRKAVGGRRASFIGADRPTMVRRIYDQPLALPHRSGGEPDGWLLRGIEHGPVETFTGPYRIAGGWWRSPSGRSLSRDYFFVRLRRGDVCWVFFDRERRSWFLEGRVE